MPHCIIEHSSDISGQALLPVAYEAAFASGLFGGPDIKARAVAFDHALVGGEPASFIHVTLRILSGRTEQQKHALSTLVASRIGEHAPAGCALTVEVVDMDRASYSKLLV